VPLTPFREAVIVEVPALELVNRPLELMMATETFDELQLTWLVRFIVDPSLNVPFAANCCVDPVLMLAVAGVTLKDVSVAFVTVREAAPA
jgi:hypothetical protein